MDKSVDNWSKWEPTSHLRWVKGVLNQRFERKRGITPRVIGPDAHDRAAEWEAEEQWCEVKGTRKGDWDFLPGLFLAMVCVAGIFGLLGYLVEFLKNG